nr:MAG TPA: hypothetical protein [Caudoviricetes sp.]
MNGVCAMNYIESIYKYCKMADILEQARDFVQSDYDSGKIFSDKDTRNGYTDTIYFLEIAREKVLEMAEKWAGKDK